MDRRSWLWRRKSSEKSPGESEISGSISSERFSDGQASPVQSTHSAEVNSKSVLNGEEIDGSVKALTEKLSAALVNLSVKEDLIKQHAKVAEEAVSGWEKAENEVIALKRQLEGSIIKNSTLEDRVGHLEGALKECVRQLRQSREDRVDVVEKKTSEWEMTKSVLEKRIMELQTRLQITDSDPRPKLEAAEKLNSTLKTQLLSLAKKLEIRVIERDLSTQAAEAASKQHLDSIKKMAKLDAECRKLKAMVRKISPLHDHKLYSPSLYVESSIDSQSDSRERLMAIAMDSRISRGLDENVLDISFSRSLTSQQLVEINFMDDFLEMERLASVPVAGSQVCCVNAETGPDHSSCKSQLEVMIQRTAELEEKLEGVEEEKLNLETALADCKNQLERSLSQLKEDEVTFVELHRQLDVMSELKEAAEEELRALKTKQEASEAQASRVEAEIKSLVSKVHSMEEENETERALAAANGAKIKKLEDELSRTKQNTEFLHEAEILRVKDADRELKLKQEKELAMAAEKFAQCQKTMASLSQKLNSLAALDDFLSDSDQPLHSRGQGVQSRLQVQVR